MNLTIVRRLLVALTLPVLLVIAACASDDPSPVSTAAPEPELDVITTLYAVTYFSERVGGERAQVESLIKAGVDAHAFEPVPSDVIAIGEADVLVFNHPAFESWVADAINAANSQSLVVVKTADLPDDIEIAHDHGDEDGHGEDEHGDHEGEHGKHGSEETELVEALAHVIEEVEHGDHDDDEHADKEDEHGHDASMDPHVWLSPLKAIKQVRVIQDAFSTADPEGAGLYTQNANTLVDELRTLDAEFSAGLSSCSMDHMIVSHEAYRHLAEAYGIEQIGLQGLSTEGETTPQQVAQIVEKITELGSRHLLQEPIAGSALVETVAAETGSEILPLHPMESLTPAELDRGATYFTIMIENLRSLRVALGCS
jgi:zinc transport system substrate-binding protein